MKGMRLLSDAEVEKANRVNILQYAKTLGIEVKQVSGRAFKVPDYGGLYIDADGSKWNCFSQNVGGGPIQFAMHVQNVSWAEAVRAMLGLTDEDLRIAAPVKEKQREPFQLPEKAESMKHVFAYLIGHRHLDKHVVYDMVRRGLLYENTMHSCVFVGRDKNGEPRHASIRSTNTYGDSFRMDAKNSDKAFSFNIPGIGKKLLVFESPIDMLSYMSIMRKNGVPDFQYHLLSLGGVSDRALSRYLKDYPDIRQMVLCLDNDEAGKQACRELAAKFRGRAEVSVHLPERKDWNEDLVAQVQNNSKRESPVEEELFHP